MPFLAVTCRLPLAVKEQPYPIPISKKCKVCIITIRQMIEPRALLAKLDLSDAEIDVYLAMIGGAVGARDIVQVTSRSRPTVYYALTSLERRGILSKTGLEEGQSFRVEPLSRLKTIAAEKQAEAEVLRDNVEEFITQFRSQKRGD